MNKKVLLISSLLFSAMAYSQTIKGRIVQETPSVSALKVLVKKEGKELVYPVDEKGAFSILLPEGGIYTLQVVENTNILSDRNIMITDSETLDLGDIIINENKVDSTPNIEEPKQEIKEEQLAENNHENNPEQEDPTNPKSKNNKEDGKEHVLQTVEIVGRARKDYNSDYSFSSSKIALKNMEVAQSISTVTKELLSDRQVFMIGDALKNVTGVNATSYYSHYAIRGVTQGWGNRDNNRLINGMTAFVSYISPPMTINLERIEVIKGPASITFASANAGGTINMVTKKPLSVARKEVDLTIGSYGTVRSTLDFTGPLEKSKTLLYRLNLGYENSRSFRDLQGSKSYMIAPTISYIPNEKTRVNLELVLTNTDTKLDRGQPIFGVKKGQSANLHTTPISFAIGASNDYNKNLNFTVMSSLSHKFTDKIGLNMSYMKHIWDEDLLEHRTANKFAQDITGKAIPTLVEMQVSQRRQKTYSDNFSAYFNFDFNIGKLKNKMVAGYDLSAFEVSRNGGWNRARGYRLTNGKVANKFNPANAANYLTDANGNPVPNVPHFDLQNPKYYVANLNDYVFQRLEITPLHFMTNGAYLMNQMSYGKFIVNFGIRQEWYLDKTNYKLKNEVATKQHKLLKRLGVIYEATKNMNVYASYIEGFEVQTNAYLGTTAYGGPFSPMTSKMLEGGLKTEWLDGKLNANIAYFNIHQQNVLMDDPNDNDALKIEGGDQRSQGIEMEVIGRILPNWQVNAGYSFIDAKTTENGERYRSGNTPKHSFNLWTRYNFEEGALKNFGIGLGGNYVGDRIAWADRTLSIPSYVVVDAAVYYKLNKMQLAVNVGNVFNKTYWGGAFDYTRLFPGTPRNVMFNVKYSF